MTNNHQGEGQMRNGDWIQTFTGRKFWPVDPRADEIEIEDIAHALSLLCRYGGHCLRFYSVAEHSVLLSRAMAPEFKLHALLHDASEAYLIDLPRPIKNCLPGYREAEAAIEAAVAERFGLPPVMPPQVKEADTRILMDERAVNMRNAPSKWTTDTTPLGIELQFWSPYRAEVEFLNEFESLTTRIRAALETGASGTFKIGDRVRKTKGSRWQGRIVGTYSTSLTPEGYCVESETEVGSVQIYPAAALEGRSDG